MKIFLLVLLLALPARAEWEPPKPVEIGAFAVAQALIVADCWTTMDFRYRLHHKEAGLPKILLGLSEPNRAEIYGFCGASMAVTTLTWYALPSPWRNVLTVGLVGGETWAISNNLSAGARFRW